MLKLVEVIRAVQTSDETTAAIVGEGLDSAIFVSIAFAGTGAALANPIVTTWLIKVGWETAATPFTYAIP